MVVSKFLTWDMVISIYGLQYDISKHKMICWKGKLELVTIYLYITYIMKSPKKMMGIMETTNKGLYKLINLYKNVSKVLELNNSVKIINN